MLGDKAKPYMMHDLRNSHLVKLRICAAKLDASLSLTFDLALARGIAHLEQELSTLTADGNEGGDDPIAEPA